MKTNFLLPNKFKKFGWILLVPSIIFGILMFFFKFYDFKPLEFKVFAIANISFGDCYFCIIKDNISNEIIGILLLLSLIMIEFSKEKNEEPSPFYLINFQNEALPILEKIGESIKAIL